jgi:DNA-binding NarL/FixJ family response regulator
MLVHREKNQLPDAAERDTGVLNMRNNSALSQSAKPATTSLNPVRVFVAAKSDFAIDGLLSLMKGCNGIKVLACVEPSEGCWQMLHEEQPDLLLLHRDAVIAPVNEFVARIHNELPGVRIIVFGQKMAQPFLFDVVMAGVDGYINENMNSSHLLKAIDSVMDGRLWVERIILEEMAVHARQMQGFIERSILEKIDSVRMLLTERETTVLRHVLEGKATKEIAATMSVSEQSVKLHLGNMFAKFSVTNRSQLILHMYSRVCPVSNMIRLFRMSLDKRRLSKGRPSLLPDPLESCDD